MNLETLNTHPTRQVVAYLGPAGSYSHAAALKGFGAEVELLPVADIPAVFAAVERGHAAFGVVPVENSSEGAIALTLDLLFTTPLTIQAEWLLPIHHCLLAQPGTREGDIRLIRAHPQALGQCRVWLQGHYPAVEKVAASSNSEAARLAATEAGVAAIAGRTAAALYDLEVVASSIEDAHDNTTRFLSLAHGAHPPLSGCDKTSLFFLVRNEPGALLRALEPFHRHGINLCKLESRPSRKAAWSYSFYVDVDGHRDDARMSAALEELGRVSMEVKLLGSYPAARQPV
ncbi:MAG: prephenate dehydratase [Pseudomonadales bacterium]|jgi:chorismate mutase/prephenate dehydratase|nr:prephenate dehydratase [Pseudomonadales bacterium]